MKPTILYWKFMVLIAIFISCENHDLGDGKRGVAIVEETADIFCGLPVVRFVSYAGESPAMDFLTIPVFTAFNLDPSLNMKGAELIIEFGDVPAEKLQPCLAVGTWYQSIWVKTAKRIK